MNAPLALEVKTPPTLAALVDDYFTLYAGRDTSRTHRLAWWVARLGARPVTSITDDDIFEALEVLAQEPARRYAGRDAKGKKLYMTWERSGATINRYGVALGALFTWAIKRRRVPKGWENPCRKIERQKERQGVVRFLTVDERVRLLAACRAAKWKRLYLLVLLAITTGARRGELLALRWGDIDLDLARAHVCTTKNGESKVLPLVPAAVDELRPLQARAEALVFPSRSNPNKAYCFEMVWRAALQASRVPKFRFHDLRHTCASYLAQNGASLLEIADVLGHRQLAMTKRYAHLTVGSKASVINRVLGDIR